MPQPVNEASTWRLTSFEFGNIKQSNFISGFFKGISMVSSFAENRRYSIACGIKSRSFHSFGGAIVFLAEVSEEFSSTYKMRFFSFLRYNISYKVRKDRRIFGYSQNGGEPRVIFEHVRKHRHIYVFFTVGYAGARDGACPDSSLRGSDHTATGSDTAISQRRRTRGCRVWGRRAAGCVWLFRVGWR